MELYHLMITIVFPIFSILLSFYLLKTVLDWPFDYVSTKKNTLKITLCQTLFQENVRRFSSPGDPDTWVKRRIPFVIDNVIGRLNNLS